MSGTAALAAARKRRATPQPNQMNQPTQMNQMNQSSASKSNMSNDSIPEEFINNYKLPKDKTFKTSEFNGKFNFNNKTYLQIFSNTK